MDWDNIEYIAQQIEESVELKTIKRGWDYYKKGRVVNYNVSSHNNIQGRVLGNEEYNLTIYHDYFLDSQCSCPVVGPCKHILATFFKVFESLGDPQNLYFELLGITPLSQQLNKGASTEMNLKATDTVTSWYKEFPKAFGSSLDDYNMLMNFHRARLAVFNSIKDWPENSKNLLLLNFYMFFLNVLQEGPQRGYLANYYKHDLGLMVRDFFYVAERIDFNRLNISESDMLKPVREIIRTNLIYGEDPPIVSWLKIYRNLWGKQLRQGELREEEKSFLNNLSGQQNSQGESYRINLALSHFEFMEGDFDRVQELLNIPSQVDITHLMDYLDSIERMEAWDYLAKWLLWLLPHVDTGGYYDKEKVFQYIGQHINRFALEEQHRFLNSLSKTLPRGLERYGWVLISLGKYQEWVECHLLFRNEYFHFDKEQMKIVEKEAREALLPLYHQLVLSLIWKRKRESYKQAVKYLKKIKGIYKKLKQEKIWKDYLNSLITETRRLKAFNEELSKGKLIDHD